MKTYSAKDILKLTKNFVKKGAPVAFHDFSEKQLEFELDIVQRERLNEETIEYCECSGKYNNVYKGFCHTCNKPIKQQM